MKAAIQITWSIGLIGALVATLIILKEVALVLQSIRSIHRLAEYTREASQGVERNLANVSKLDGLANPARGMAQASGNLVSATASVEQKLDTIASNGSSEGRKHASTCHPLRPGGLAPAHHPHARTSPYSKIT